MSERQRRTDAAMANAVARGLNILAIRDAGLAQRYMRYKGVPDAVIDRIFAEPGARRQPSAEQSISEAITPSRPGDPSADRPGGDR